jgi:hypothetical protein
MRHHTSSRAARNRSRSIGLALLLTLSLVGAAPVGAVQPPGQADPAVIAKWNGIAAATIPANPAAFLNYAFVHLAMYNAVVGITHEYELYKWDVDGPRKASPEAAAAVAAHRVLRTYFGGAAASLDAELAASLAAVPDGVRKDQGIRYGRLAADRIIELRTNDGRGAAVTVPIADAAGEWRPTPPAFGQFAVPWLGGVTPLVLDSLTQFDPGAPPAIGTDLYRAELEEVRLIGAVDSVTRTADQTTTARYFADIPFGPMEAGLRDVANRYALDISDSARLFAATNTSIADAIGTAWNAKLRYLWWRPITAIREDHDDGDAATVPVPDWTPLLTTPPYPEWPSGLCSVLGAITTSLQHLTGQVDVTIVSPSQGPRHFGSKAQLDQDCVDARVWSGIHFRTSDQVAIGIGTGVTDYVLDRYFGPTQ